MNKELLKGTIDIFILLLLSKKDSYGYEMVKIIKELTKGDYEISEGTLYPALRRLESKNLLDTYYIEQNSIKRKYYSINSLGINFIDQKLKEWQKINELIKIFKEG